MTKANADRTLSHKERELAELRLRLSDAEETIQALLSGQVDAVSTAEAATPLLVAKAQEALRSSERWYREIVETANDGLVISDPDLKTTYVNRRMAEMLGYAQADLIGKSLLDLTDEQERSAAIERMDRRRRGVAERHELRMKRKDETDLWVLVSSSPLRDSDGRFAGSLSMVMDISEQKRALEMLARTEALRREVEAGKSTALEALNEAEAKKSIAEEANRAKSTFLAMMSHELRTPLNAIIGFSEVLIDGQFGHTSARGMRYLKNVLSSGRHLLGLINSLLDLSKIEAGKLEVTQQPCALRVLAQEAMTTVQPLADARQITLLMDVAAVAPIPMVVADPVRCKQVFYNLLSNSIKFTPKGGQVMVACSITTSGKRVRAAISDTGPGIKGDDLERLFKPFEQLRQSEGNAVSGTGLGLALCKQLVELMGGEVGVNSTHGSGSVFFFELPVGTFGDRGQVVSPRTTTDKVFASVAKGDPSA